MTLPSITEPRSLERQLAAQAREAFYRAYRESGAAQQPCDHPELFWEYKPHLDEMVCACGARHQWGELWYRPEYAIDRRPGSAWDLAQQPPRP